MLKDKAFTKVQKISGFSFWMLILARIVVARVLQKALVKLRNLAGEVTPAMEPGDRISIFHHARNQETGLLLQGFKWHQGLGILESKILKGTGEVTRVTRQISNSNSNDILSGLTGQQAETMAARAVEYQIQSSSAITGRFKVRRYNVDE